MRFLIYGKESTETLRLTDALKAANCIVDREYDIAGLNRDDAQSLKSQNLYAAVLAPGELTNLFKDKSSNVPVFQNNITIQQLFGRMAVVAGHGFAGHVVGARLGEDVLSIDLIDRKKCTKNGEPLALTARQHALLRILAAAPVRGVDRSYIEQHIPTKTGEMSSNLLGQHLYRLRVKIGVNFVPKSVAGRYILGGCRDNASLSPEGLVMDRHDNIYFDGNLVKLDPIKLKILSFLMNRADRPMSRDQILAHIYPNEADRRHLSQRYVRVQICQLNKILAKASQSEQNPDGLKFIDNVWSVGYKFLSSPISLSPPENEFDVKGRVFVSDSLVIDTAGRQVMSIKGKNLQRHSITERDAAIAEYIFDNPGLQASWLQKHLGVKKTAFPSHLMNPLRKRIGRVGENYRRHLGAAGPKAIASHSGFSMPLAREAERVSLQHLLSNHAEPSELNI